jgi:hypothetical protein
MVHTFLPRGEHNLTRCEFKFARKNKILSKLKTIFSFTFFRSSKICKIGIMHSKDILRVQCEPKTYWEL